MSLSSDAIERMNNHFHATCELGVALKFLPNQPSLSKFGARHLYSFGSAASASAADSGSQGMALFSSSQRPRSTSRHRTLQKGMAGDLLASKTFPQVGQRYFLMAFMALTDYARRQLF